MLTKLKDFNLKSNMVTQNFDNFYKLPDFIEAHKFNKFYEILDYHIPSVILNFKISTPNSHQRSIKLYYRASYKSIMLVSFSNLRLKLQNLIWLIRFGHPKFLRHFRIGGFLRVFLIAEYEFIINIA